MAAALAMTGCNHLFYYPDTFERMTPEKLELSYESFTMTTPDGLKLKGWHIRTTTPKPHATIIHFHGNAENMSTHFLFFAWLAEAGFDLVEFDYRGYGSSEGEPEREGLVADGVTALTWARANSRSKDLFVIGQSLGGAVAIPALVKAGTPGVRAVILDSTFASYRDVARRKLGSFWLTWPLQWPLSLLVSNELSPVDFVGEIRVPMLFVHSPRDPVVPFESVLALYEAAPSPKEFWKVEWGGHTSAFVVDDDRYRQKLIVYLCDKLSEKSPGCSTTKQCTTNPPC